MMISEPVTVLLVDDHAVVREGYRRLLERSSSIRVIGEAADAQSAYLAFTLHHPQVTIMDIALPGASGIDALRRIRARDAAAQVLMFSMYEDPVFAMRALQAGARGYVTKASAPDVLVEAVLAVARGKSYISPQVAQALALRSIAPTEDPASQLSPREFEVLRLLVAGMPLRDIARQLGLTPKTVANHQSILRQKLGAETAMQLLHVATRMGIAQESRSA
jgi:two-component system, NarL family, invasion response regulator UvrY